MTAGLTAALIVVAVLGTWFRNTKPLGISACAALCLIYPWLALLIVLVIVGTFLFNARQR